MFQLVPYIYTRNQVVTRPSLVNHEGKNCPEMRDTNGGYFAIKIRITSIKKNIHYLPWNVRHSLQLRRRPKTSQFSSVVQQILVVRRGQG